MRALQVDNASNIHTFLRLCQGMVLRCPPLSTHRAYLLRHRDQFQTAYITSHPPVRHATSLHRIHITLSRDHLTITPPRTYTRHTYPTLPPPIVPHLCRPSLRRLLTHPTHTKRQNISFTRITLRISRKKCELREARRPIGLAIPGVTPIRWRSHLHRRRTTLLVARWKFNLLHRYQNTGLVPGLIPTTRCPLTTPRQHRAPNSAVSYTSVLAKKHSRWGLSMFGHGEKVHQQSLPPVDEVPGSNSTPSLKRTQSTSSDSPSLAEMQPINGPPRKDAKAIKKEAERQLREAEKQRRAMAERTQREQARAVIQKRNQMYKHTTTRNELEWMWQTHANLLNPHQRGAPYEDIEKSKLSASGPIRQKETQASAKVSSPTLNAASGRYINPIDGTLAPTDRWGLRDERLAKARRRDFDDDHSMSSSDVHSLSRMSAISFATVDSDPGPSRTRRPTLFGINRMTSASSLRTGTTSFDEFPTSARSSNSISLDHQFNDFCIRGSVDTTSSASGASSPPPINLLSLSPSPRPWICTDSTSPQHSSYMVPPIIQYPSSSHKTYECNGQLYGHPPSPGIDPQAAINPIFKVTPLPTSPSDLLSSPHSLPPFSQLEAVAEGEYPPLSPMSFHSPEDD